MPAIVEVMHSSVQISRRGTALATGLLIALTLFGVLLMHSVTPMASIGGGHDEMVSTSPVDSSVQMAFGDQGCPPTHQMMHPCVGVPVSWSALTVPPALTVEIEMVQTSVDRLGWRTDSTLERAPPWSVWELDKSVTLRV